MHPMPSPRGQSSQQLTRGAENHAPLPHSAGSCHTHQRLAGTWGNHYTITTYIMPYKCHLCTCSVFLVYQYIIMPYKMTLDIYIAGLLKLHVFEVQSSHLMNNYYYGNVACLCTKTLKQC